MNWCNKYQCWCDEAEDITENMGDCDYDCRGCPEVDKVT